MKMKKKKEINDMKEIYALKKICFFKLVFVYQFVYLNFWFISSLLSLPRSCSSFFVYHCNFRGREKERKKNTYNLYN